MLEALGTDISILLSKINTWANKSDKNSWIAHGVIAIPMTLAIGAYATSAVYLVRELEQFAHEKIEGVKPKYTDHFYDWLVPSIVAMIVGAVFQRP